MIVDHCHHGMVKVPLLANLMMEMPIVTWKTPTHSSPSLARLVYNLVLEYV